MSSTPPSSLWLGDQVCTLSIKGKGGIQQGWIDNDDIVTTHVRCQGNCSACWAWVAAEATRAAMLLAGKKVPQLSPQDLVNCTYKGRTRCRGGQSIVALQWIVENGICTEADCPYEGKKPLKAPKRPKEKYFLDSWKIVEDDEESMEKALEQQPLIVSIPDVTAIRCYTTGLMDLTRAIDLYHAAIASGTIPNKEDQEHTVLLVARGHIIPHGWPNFPVKFWRIKNQWDIVWGEKGFGDIIYNSSLIDLKRKLLMDETNSMWFYSPLVPLMNELEKHKVNKVTESLEPVELREKVEKNPHITLLILLYNESHTEEDPKFLDDFKLLGRIYEYDVDVTLACVNLGNYPNAPDILEVRLSRKPALLYFPSPKFGDRNLQNGFKFPENQKLRFEPIVDWLEKVSSSKLASRKRHLNVVFIGHIGAGKSTIGGQILLLSGQVDECTIQKYEKVAKDKAKNKWYMEYIMDTDKEEHAKGKTVEVGRPYFETETTRFRILDAPGHKSYVPNMISGASQADIGVLVISARKGEFETGFEKGGQTREHAMFAKTLGVTKLLVVVNKMDDPTVNWSKERYDEIESKMIPFLKSSDYNVNKDVQFLPISGLLGTNMMESVNKSVCTWWGGPSLLKAMDVIEGPVRDPVGPLRMPITNKFRSMGTVVMGKIESGGISEGVSLIIMPNEAHVKVTAIHIDDKIKKRVKNAVPGENIRVRLSGISEEDVLPGCVLSSISNPVAAVNEFNVHLHFLELVENEIFTAGYKAILHIHSVAENCEIVDLLEEIDPETKKPMKKKPPSVKSGAVALCRIRVNNLICVEKFSDFPQLGRFTLCKEGKTVAVGEIIDLSVA